MPKANGASLRVIAFVAANPGCDYATLCEGADVPPRGGLVSYMLSRGMVFMAGPRGCRRYYPTADQAAAAHDALVAQAEQARREVKRRADIEQARRRKAFSRMLGKSRNTRPAQAIEGEPSADTFIVSGVRVRLARHRRSDQAAPPVVAPTDCRPWAKTVAQEAA
jgi:hypothetical protein